MQLTYTYYRQLLDRLPDRWRWQLRYLIVDRIYAWSQFYSGRLTRSFAILDGARS